MIFENTLNCFHRFFCNFTPSFANSACLSALLLQVCCAPNIVKYSGRNPDLFQKPSDKMYGQSRGSDGHSNQPEVFVKEKKVLFKEVNKPNTSGSLFDSEYEANYLFVPANIAKIGRMLQIQIKPNRQSPIASENPAPTQGEAPKSDSPENKSEEDDLLKALPQLEPKNKGQVALLKDFKMKIVHKFANGDVLARLERNSSSESDFHTINLEARIPYDRLASGDSLTTDDLLDVKFAEFLPEEAIKRQSSGWEDEYSLRLSGFNEAKSKMAAELDDQKAKLEEARQRLQDRIKSVGTERRQIAKMREEMAQKRQEAENKVKNINSKLEESNGLIEEQKATIEEQEQVIESMESEKAGTKKGGKDE